MKKRDLIIIIIVLILIVIEAGFVYWLYTSPVEEVSFQITAKEPLPQDSPNTAANEPLPDNSSNIALDQGEAAQFRENLSRAPAQIRVCLKGKIGEERFSQIESGQIAPDSEDKAELEQCFDELFSSLQQGE